MRIGLNATCFNNRPSGARQRFLGLYLPTILALPDVHFVVYSAADINAEHWFRNVQNVSIRRTPVPSEGRWNRIISGLGYWPTTLRKDKLDLLEGFHLPPVSNPAGRTVMTIHDLRGLHPDTQYSRRSVYLTALNYSIRRSDSIITVSNSMKQEIEAFFPNAKVTRIYNGIDSRIFKQIDDNEANKFLREKKLPFDFLLAVGHYEIRKNYVRLISAVKSLNDQGLSMPLVIAGNDSGQFEELRHRVTMAGLEKQVVLLRNLDDDQIRWLYHKCRLVVFPSSYEGFGIPVLEAMAAKKPFVLSDIAVFKELSEEQGVYFAHNDVNAMASAIAILARSNVEQKRLIDYGGRRVKDFSFNRLSKELVSFYQAQASALN
ncbi:MAG: glycosyltransferase family 1 protein [Rhizobiaceae bacterium]|nr:glycosyltransferase family 1 protein [Rhizobiaceae bacterium]